MTDTEALQAGFQQRGNPGEMLGEWMRREMAEKTARGEVPPFDLGPTVSAIWKDQAEAELSQRIAERDGLRARLFEMQNAAIDLAKDNERLRALIAKQEKVFDGDCSSECPWCKGTYASADLLTPQFKHAADCHAFSAPGVVR